MGGKDGSVGRKRFPRWVFAAGEEPDPRFSLANERTYLAWIRTSLAMMAAGVALHVFDIGDGSVAGVIALILLIASSVAIPLLAWCNWARSERSMRHGQALPSSAMAVPLAIVLGAVGVLVLWAIFR